MNRAEYCVAQIRGHLPAKVALLFLIIIAASSLAACAAAPSAAGTAPRLQTPGLPNPLDAYRKLDFVVGDDGFPAVGRFLYLPGPGDSTIVILALSFPNRALHFRREPPGLLARYRITATVGDSAATRVLLDETREVRVSTYRETARDDESVIFQGFFKLRPGNYTVSLHARDLGSDAGLTDERGLQVPDLGPTTVPAPVLAYRGRPRSGPRQPPSLIVAPRSTAIMDRPPPVAYVESTVRDGPPPVLEILIDEEVIWSDTLNASAPDSAAVRSAPDSASAWRSGIIELDLGALSPGSLMRMRARAATSTSDSQPLLLALNEDLLFVDYDTLLSYLRYAGTPEELQELRNAAAGERARRLHTFWKRRDPDPGTAENEFFDEYFGRIQEANNRFSEPGTPGWLTDRGAVYVTLGPPDEVLRHFDPVDLGPTGSQVWVYDRSLGFELRLSFAPEPAGFGLTRESRRAFLEALRRIYAEEPERLDARRRQRDSSDRTG